MQPDPPMNPGAAKASAELTLEWAKILLAQRNWHADQLQKINWRATVLLITGVASSVVASDKITAAFHGHPRYAVAVLFLVVVAMALVALSLFAYFRFHSWASSLAARRLELLLRARAADVPGEVLDLQTHADRSTGPATGDPDSVFAPMPEPGGPDPGAARWASLDFRMHANRLLAAGIVLAVTAGIVFLFLAALVNVPAKP